MPTREPRVGSERKPTIGEGRDPVSRAGRPGRGAERPLLSPLASERRRTRQAEERVLALETELQRQRERIRDLGERLLTAQETECARIARELHDDIGQQLAVLCIDLAASGASDAAVRRAEDIAKNVAALSRRLYERDRAFFYQAFHLDRVRTT